MRKPGITGTSGEEEEGAPRGLDRRGATAYQWAAEAAFSIPIAIGLGYWADTKLGTSPIFLLVGVVLGFAAFVLRLVRMRRLVEEAAQEALEQGVGPVPEEEPDAEEAWGAGGQETPSEPDEPHGPSER